MALLMQRNEAPDTTSVVTTRPRINASGAAGLLFMLAGVAMLMGIITAEAVYPDVYTTYENEISDLGATRPPNSIIREPSATIFNTVMIASGVLILGGAFMAHRALHTKRVTISTACLGIGVLGVGVFPGNVETLHPLFALTAFLSAGLAAVLSAHVQLAPMRYVSIGLGLTTLVWLGIGIFGTGTVIFDELGDGGVERWVAYPAILWIVAFGGYLGALGALQEKLSSKTSCRDVRLIPGDVRRPAN